MAATLALLSCASFENRPPILLPIDDAIFMVNVSGNLEVLASDPDGDPLEFELVAVEPPPPTRTEGEAGQPQLVQLDAHKARFIWTPGIADAGSDVNETAYTISLAVSDQAGERDLVNVGIRVVNEGLTGTGLTFTEPLGGGIAIDLAADPAPCLSIPVSVRDDRIESTLVNMVLIDPPEGATLRPPGPGKSKFLGWCPSPEQLGESLRQTFTIEARQEGSDKVVPKRIVAHFQRVTGDGCTTTAPVIEHAPPETLLGHLNYELHARIVDDVGFRFPPFILYSVQSGGVPSDGASWIMTGLEPTDDLATEWRGEIPNLNLAPGEQAEIAYRIVATDEDSAGTECDHTTETEVFRVLAVGPEPESEVAEGSYGACHGCVADAQCGGALDLCVRLAGQDFCVVACGAGCEEGTTCREVVSIEGRGATACVPDGEDCGHLCVPDEYEAVGGDMAASAAPIAAGRHAASMCRQGDDDHFGFSVEAGVSIRARIDFDPTSTDLDLLMTAPGGVDYQYRSESMMRPYETVFEACSPTGGAVELAVVAATAAPYVNYELTLELGPCDRTCVEDRLAPNGSPEDATVLDELPYLADGLFLCPGDRDYFALDLDAGTYLTGTVKFDPGEGNLNVWIIGPSGEVLNRSDVSADDDSELFADEAGLAIELIILEAVVGGRHLLMIEGDTPSVRAPYRIELGALPPDACEQDADCGTEYVCDAAGACVPDTCDSQAICDAHGALLRCVGESSGGSGGGHCTASCEGDSMCREGFACKAFEDFTRGCVSTGEGVAGDACLGHASCAGSLICLDLPGGYCASSGCLPGTCPSGTVCTDSAAGLACIKACIGASDCRVEEGYECRDEGQGGVCLPAAAG